MGFYRTHNCSDLSANLNDTKVKLSGWVQKVRDHGGVLFLDLRDRSGICQVVVPPSVSSLEKIRSEFVVQIEGVVKKRPDGMINRKIPSGEIEIHASSLKVLNESEVLPFELDEENIGVN